jgi:hypothetical protein
MIPLASLIKVKEMVINIAQTNNSNLLKVKTRPHI